MKQLLILFFVCISAPCNATTWSPSTVTDPISGKDCQVYRVASYGSYIYQWESQYDGVYWPYVDEHWRWDCQESGYISFGSDFWILPRRRLSALQIILRRILRDMEGNSNVWKTSTS